MTTEIFEHSKFFNLLRINGHCWILLKKMPEENIDYFFVISQSTGILPSKNKRRNRIMVLMNEFVSRKDIENVAFIFFVSLIINELSYKNIVICPPCTYFFIFVNPEEKINNYGHFCNPQ